MRKMLLLLVLLLFPALPGCAVAEWLLGSSYSAAERTEHWRDSTDHDDWQQSEFNY